MKRTRFDIINEILTLCRVPRAKTRIMYVVNMSYVQTIEYIEELKQRKFLDFNGQTYKTSLLGHEFLEGLDLVLAIWHDHETEKDRRLAIDFL
jgi:predicted transcriptional regulator